MRDDQSDMWKIPNKIGKWALIRLRFQLNLKRSVRTEEQQAQAEAFPTSSSQSSTPALNATSTARQRTFEALK